MLDKVAFTFAGYRVKADAKVEQEYVNVYIAAGRSRR